MDALDIADPRYKLSYWSLQIMLVFLLTCQMVVNMDHGALPASTLVIKRDLDLNNAQLGKLGSLVFAGLVCGSLFATIVFNNLSYKSVLAFSFLGNAVGLILFAKSPYYCLQCFARFFSGFN